MSELLCAGAGFGSGCGEATPHPRHEMQWTAEGIDRASEGRKMALVRDTVSFVLEAAATDPDVRRIIMPGTELFERLCDAEAALLGRPIEDVMAQRTQQIPEGPRRYMTYQEWSRARAGEIAAEGSLGSHWPGKASDR